MLGTPHLTPGCTIELGSNSDGIPHCVGKTCGECQHFAGKKNRWKQIWKGHCLKFPALMRGKKGAEFSADLFACRYFQPRQDQGEKLK